MTTPLEYLKRDGVKIHAYGCISWELVTGRLLQLTNPDRSRTYAAFHQPRVVSTSTKRRCRGMPEPILFMQSWRG